MLPNSCQEGLWLLAILFACSLPASCPEPRPTVGYKGSKRNHCLRRDSSLCFLSAIDNAIDSALGIDPSEAPAINRERKASASIGSRQFTSELVLSTNPQGLGIRPGAPRVTASRAVHRADYGGATAGLVSSARRSLASVNGQGLLSLLNEAENMLEEARGTMDRNNLVEASVQYDISRRWLESKRSEFDDDSELAEKWTSVLSGCRLKLATCFFRIGDYEVACKHCASVIHDDQNKHRSGKALYLRGVAFRGWAHKERKKAEVSGHATEALAKSLHLLKMAYEVRPDPPRSSCETTSAQL